MLFYLTVEYYIFRTGYLPRCTILTLKIDIGNNKSPSNFAKKRFIYNLTHTIRK